MLRRLLLALVLLLLPATSWAALAYVSQSSGSSVTSTTVASTATSNAAGNALVAHISWITTGGSTISTVTDTAGSSWTKIAGPSVNSMSLETWYTCNGSGNASNVVTATFITATPPRAAIVVEEISGQETASCSDGSSSATGTSTTPSSGTIVTTTADDFLSVAILCTNSGITVTPGTSYTERVEQATAEHLELQDRIVTATGTYGSTDGTLSGWIEWGGVQVAIKAASGAADEVFGFRRRRVQ